MGKGNYLGEFEQIVLLALTRVGDQAYGVPVHAEILRTTGRDVAIASVYVTLGRLDAKGLVKSVRESRDVAQGRPRRFYSLTERGWRGLQQSRETMNQLWAGVEKPEELR